MYKQKDVETLRYVIVPAKLPRNCTFLETYNRIYAFWHSSWSKTFAESGNPRGHWPDHFLRQDLIVALLNSEEVAACHLATFYPLEALSTQGSEYFHYINKQTFDSLRAKNMKYPMTIEYLCVDPSWRKNSAKISLGKLLISLGTCVADLKGANGILGMPITGTKVDAMLENVGGIVIQPEIQKFGYKLKFQIVPTSPRAASRDPVVEEYTQRFWLNREDYSEKVQTNLQIVDDSQRLAA